MRYVIMCAGKGTRWGNYMNTPKHLVKINGETLLGRTTRLLKENNITDYVITGSDERYKKYGELIPQSCNDCEIDRFEEVEDSEICYLYGDVYYTEEAMKTIIKTKIKDIMFFGSNDEIFAVKVKNIDLFFKHKNKVKQLYLENKIDRCIGWEIYRSLHEIAFKEHLIKDRYVKILDETDDIDFPMDYNRFVEKRSKI